MGRAAIRAARSGCWTAHVLGAASAKTKMTHIGYKGAGPIITDLLGGHLHCASVGFPGMVRNGRILSAPHLVLSSGPDSKVDPTSVKAWGNFDLASARCLRVSCAGARVPLVDSHH